MREYLINRDGYRASDILSSDIRYGTKEECNETAVMIKTKYENGCVVVVTAESDYIVTLYKVLKENNITNSNGYQVIFFTLDELTAYSYEVYIHKYSFFK